MVSAQGNSGLGFNYQAVLRGADGFVLSNRSVELRFSLTPGKNAPATWIETHVETTDAYGTVGVTVGKGERAHGSYVSEFKAVNFAAVHYWMRVEIMEGSTTRELSYTALPSVPYAEASFSTQPVGTVIAFAGDEEKVPAGWLLCDGREVSISEYPALWEVIGAAWGNGNNSSTFNVPDMRGMFLRGVSGNSDDDADKEKRISRNGGNEGNDVGSYQEDAIRNIKGNAGMNINGAFTARIEGLFSGQLIYGINGVNLPSGWWGAYGATFDASRADDVTTGSDNRPQNVYVHYIIKY